jgi:ABC-type sulfate/molybdate transport systems ATPase subunit
MIVNDLIHPKAFTKKGPISPFDRSNHIHKKAIPNRRFQIHPSHPKNRFENELPKNAFAFLEKSYVVQKGYIVTTGIDIFIHAKDVQTIQEEDSHVIQLEIDKVSKSIGHPEHAEKIGKIFKWVVKNYYVKEKDSKGNLRCTIDFVKLISGKSKIKIGENWYTLPPELLRRRKSV